MKNIQHIHEKVINVKVCYLGEKNFYFFTFLTIILDVPRSAVYVQRYERNENILPL